MKKRKVEIYGPAGARDSERGQTMIEYVVVAGILTACMAVLMLLLLTFKEYGARILEMIASDYP